MDSRDNATWLFEGLGDIPRHSESFWTSLFALFLLHLAGREAGLTVWQCKEAPDGSYYEPRGVAGPFALKGVQMADISVEPPAERMQNFVGDLLGEKVAAAGIRPDLLIRVPLVAPSRQFKCVFIENKTTGRLQRNQEQNYPELIRRFKEKGKPSEFLLLTSVGSPELYASAKRFQVAMHESFGLLLWEEVLREMKAQEFKLPGIDVEVWQPFTSELDRAATQRRATAGG